jgi:hypothetical protein
MEQKKISKVNYWAARAVLDYHREQQKKLSSLEEMLASLLGIKEEVHYPGYYGLLTDVIWTDGDLDELLNELCISIEDEENS